MGSESVFLLDPSPHDKELKKERMGMIEKMVAGSNNEIRGTNKKEKSEEF